MNKLKIKLDGALKDIRVNDKLKGEIISMTENKKNRRPSRLALIVAVACLLLALAGGAIAAANWEFVEAPSIQGHPVKGYEYGIARPREFNEDSVNAMLTEVDQNGGSYGDYDRDTLDEISSYLGVDFFESDTLTPCDENCPPRAYRSSGIILTQYSLHAYRFPDSELNWLNLRKDYHAPNGDPVDACWSFMYGGNGLSGGMVAGYPSEEVDEITTVRLTSENGLSANLICAKDADGSYFRNYDHEARLVIVGYKYHLTYDFPDYTYTDYELADLAQQILDSLPAAD